MTNPLMQYLPHIGLSLAILAIALGLWSLRTSMKATKAIDAHLDQLEETARAWNSLRGGSHD